MEAGLVTVSLLSHPKSSALATGPPYRLCKLVPEHRQADAPCMGALNCRSLRACQFALRKYNILRLTL